MLTKIAGDFRQARGISLVVIDCFKGRLPGDITQLVEKTAIICKWNAGLVKRREAVTLTQHKAQQIIVHLSCLISAYFAQGFMTA